jgi:hypothetical protein
MKKLILLLLVLFFLTSCSTPTVTDQDYPTIYVAIVMHNEEPYHIIDGLQKSNGWPDYTKDQIAFQEERENLLLLSKMFKEEKVSFNFQSDWNFLEAMLLYDNGKDTNNKNLIKYMHENLGVSIDPHAHETTYNYADVAALMEELLGYAPSGAVGGFLYYPFEDSMLDYFQEPIPGWLHEYSWQADILWGASTQFHTGPDEKVSGVWFPKGVENFFEAGDKGLPYVGGYTKNKNGVIDLLQKADDGELDPNKIYTVTINILQKNFKTKADIDNMRQDIQDIKKADKNNIINWATLQEIVSDWEIKYTYKENIYFSDNFKAPTK